MSYGFPFDNERRFEGSRPEDYYPSLRNNQRFLPPYAQIAQRSPTEEELRAWRKQNGIPEWQSTLHDLLTPVFRNIPIIYESLQRVMNPVLMLGNDLIDQYWPSSSVPRR